MITASHYIRNLHQNIKTGSLNWSFSNRTFEFKELLIFFPGFVTKKGWQEFLPFQKSTDQKQLSRGVVRKNCSEIMQQIYRRTPMPKSYFNKVAKPLRGNCFWQKSKIIIYHLRLSCTSKYTHVYTRTSARTSTCLHSVILEDTQFYSMHYYF